MSFEGRDLHAMDRISQRRFINLLHGLLPEDDDKTYFRLHHYIPYYVGRYDTPGETSKVVLVEGEPLFIIPGESRVRIQIFNLKGRRLSSVAFPTGWRIDLEGARIIRDGKDGSSLIEISTHLVIGGVDVARQLYRVAGNDVELVRLEDREGRLIGNFPPHEIGPAN